MEEQTKAIRLKGFIESKGLTYSQFADQCGIPRPSLSQFLSGRNKKLSDVMIDQIHQAFPELSVGWLLFGEGNMTVTDAPGSDELAVSSPGDVLTDSSMVEIETAQLCGGSVDSINQRNLSNDSAYSNLSGLTPPDNRCKLLEKQIVEARNQIQDLQLQLEKMTKNPRRVSQITIYYDDSTFETFLPKR